MSSSLRRARLSLLQLEEREVPAGIITASLSSGVLTLTGDDYANVIDSLTITGGTVIIDPDDETTIDDLSVAGTGTKGATVTLNDTTTSIKVAMNGGFDKLTLDPDDPLSLTGSANFDMGNGGCILQLNTSKKIELGSISVTASDGNDLINLQGGVGMVSKVAGAATINVGNGGGSTNLANIEFSGSAGLRITGGEENDVITADAVKVTKGLTAALGNGSGNRIDITNGSQFGALAASGYTLTSSLFENSTVSGNASWKFNDSVTLSFTTATINGTATISAGPQETYTTTIWKGISSIGSAAVTGGAAARIEVDALARLTVAKDAVVTANTGNATVTLIEGELSARSLSLKATKGTARVDVIKSLTANHAKLTLAGNLSLRAHATGAFNQQDGLATIAGKVAITSDESANLAVKAGSSLAVTGDISLTTKQSAASVDVVGASLAARKMTLKGGGSATLDQTNGAVSSVLDLGGSLTVNALAGEARVKIFDGNATIDGDVTATSKDNVFFSFGGLDTTLGGKLTLTAKGSDVLSEFGNQSFTVAGDTKITGKTFTNLDWSPTAASEFRGNVTIQGGVEADSLSATANVKYLKNLSISQGDGANSITLNGVAPTIGGNLSITGGAGLDSINLFSVFVSGSTKVITGAGADGFDIEVGSQFNGTFFADFGSGDDHISLAQLNGGSGPVTFFANTKILGGDGNDEVLLGKLIGDANAAVSFQINGNTVDGGTGLNLFEDEASKYAQHASVSVLNWTDPTP